MGIYVCVSLKESLACSSNIVPLVLFVVSVPNVWGIVNRLVTQCLQQ